MARRWIAGSGQLALAVTGCGMILVWFFKVMILYYGQISGGAPKHPVNWGMFVAGAIIFMVSWLWALVTSFSLFFEARRNATAEFLEKIESTGGSAPPKL
jgi:hypothetical protein